MLNLGRAALTIMLCASICLSCGDDEGEGGSEFGDGQFAELLLERASGDGFCPDMNMVIRASATRDAQGAYSISGTRAVDGDPATDTCNQKVFDTTAFTCMIEQPLGPSALSAEDVLALQQRVAAVPRRDCRRDEMLACDPCLVTNVTVDGHTATGDCCGELNADFRSAFQALVIAITSVTPAAS